MTTEPAGASPALSEGLGPLPQSLLDLIGWYGSSHANGESDTLRLWRWQELVTAIKVQIAQERAAERERCAKLCAGWME